MWREAMKTRRVYPLSVVEGLAAKAYALALAQKHRGNIKSASQEAKETFRGYQTNAAPSFWKELEEQCASIRLARIPRALSR